MRTIENLLLLCGIQTLVISVILLIGVVLLKWLGRRRSTTFVSVGLASMVLLWLLACLPINGWISPQTVMESTARLISSPESKVAHDDAASELLTGEVNHADKTSGLAIAPDNDSTFAKIAAATLQEMKHISQPAETGEASSTWRFWIAIGAMVAISFGYCD